MPFGSVTLKPGVDVESTATLSRASYSTSNLGRFRAGLFEKLGGWVKFYLFALSGVPRCLQAWQDFNDTDYLAVGTTAGLDVISNTVLTDISPQVLTSDFQPNFVTTASSPNVDVTDNNIANVTTYDSVEFKTPVSVGGVILSGVYPISLVLGTTNYRIIAATNATTTTALATITAITKASPGAVTTSGAHGFSTGDLIYIYGVVGMTQVNGQLFTITSTGANTFTLGVDTTGYTTYTSGGKASPGAVPFFTTTSGSALVSVQLAAHGLSAGGSIAFPLSTTVGGVTISGNYTVVSVTSANIFVISATNTASSSATAGMNAGQVEVIYHIAVGPLASGTGYSIGTYSSGAYSGTGSSSSQQTGTDLTATDWTLDNWGQTLLACPADGGIYQWTPNSGVQNAQLIPQAPLYNSGMFVATPYQILIAYGSTQDKDIGLDQDPLVWRASDILDYTNWTPGSTNASTGDASQAYQNRLPTGSAIKAGVATPQQILLFTDLDVWSLNYLGPPLIWGQTKIGSNCGTISRHGVAMMGGIIVWWGKNNFYGMPSAGGNPQVIPCSVWDSVFQDLDTANVDKCWVEPVEGFGEFWFHFPSLSGGTGQCDTMVKYNINENTWDGPNTMARSAGIGQSVLGQPIMATPSGIIYQHERGQDADGQPLVPYFMSGNFYLVEGEDYVYVDSFLPDFKFAYFDNAATTSAIIQITFYVRDYAGDAARVYGPYNMSTTTQKLDLRFRGRLIAFSMTSTDLGSWWRLGSCKFRYAISGRR